MKKFRDMNTFEIKQMTNEEFAAVSPFDKRSCHNCSYLTGALSLWCTNEEAKRARGTSIPGCIKCPYWSPNKKLIKQYTTMKRWNTTQQFGHELTEREEVDKASKSHWEEHPKRMMPDDKEIGIAKASKIASYITDLYWQRGGHYVLNYIHQELRDGNDFSHLTLNQRKRITKIIRIMFSLYWLPFSRIRMNMRRLKKKGQ